MKRSDLQRLALTRVEEARILLENKMYNGAYYLCGYAIECALKACIAKKTQRFEFPDREKVNSSYVHDLEKLLGVAELKLVKDKVAKKDPEFERNWSTVKDWSEKSRYQEHGEKEARDLFLAVSEKNHGVLRWLQQHW